MKISNISCIATAMLALMALSVQAASPAQIETAGGFKIKSADGKFAFELGGEIWIDKAIYRQDKDLGNNATELDDGTELRRARLSLGGKLHDDWGYAAEYDMASNEAKDMYIEYTGKKGVDIKIGNFKEPFSMEDMTSGKATIFMERALAVDAFAPGRNLGVGAFGGGKRWSLAGGVFGEAYDYDPPNGSEGDQGWGMTARGSYAPKLGGDQLLHLGMSLSERTPPKQDRELRFRDGLESHPADQDLIDTDDIDDVERLDRQGLEVAFASGPLLIQAERIGVSINRDIAAGPHLQFSGWYLSASWMLTGEERDYNGAKGRFNRIKPKGADTAWEIALRRSNLNLNDEDIDGGELQNTTLALNAYVNDNVRFRINMIRARATPNEDGDDEKVTIVQARGEIYF
jgi:phosphate-selective porin OprO/OprP